MIETYQLTVDVSDNNGIPLSEAMVRIRLDRYDLAGGSVVVPARPHVRRTDEEGKSAFALWPNSNGVRGSRYQVCIYAPSGEPIVDEVFQMPARDALLSDLLDAAD